MGRRRKANPKQSYLLFVESPVENRPPSLSPVTCADNPVTAVSVPIDDNSTIPWVSPQFEGLPTPHGKRRQARRPATATHNHVSRSCKENTRSSARSRQRKIPALNFVGDSANSASKKRRSGKAKESKEAGESSVNVECKRNRRRASAGRGKGNDGNYSCVETIRDGGGSFTKVADKHRPSLARRSVYRGRRTSGSSADVSLDQPIPVPVPTATKHRQSSQVLSALPSDTNALTLEEENNACGSVTDGGRGVGRRTRGNSSHLLLSPAESLDLSGGRGAHTPVSMAIPLRMALFAPSPSEETCDMSVNPPPPASSISDKLFDAPAHEKGASKTGVREKDRRHFSGKGAMMGNSTAVKGKERRRFDSTELEESSFVRGKEGRFSGNNGRETEESVLITGKERRHSCGERMGMEEPISIRRKKKRYSDFKLNSLEESISIAGKERRHFAVRRKERCSDGKREDMEQFTPVIGEERRLSNSRMEESTPRRSQRLKEKAKKALKYLWPGTPRDNGSSVPSKVLVADTPESEYNLCFRQRQRLMRKKQCA